MGTLSEVSCFCGVTFTSDKPNAKYCSQKCKRSSPNKNRHNRERAAKHREVLAKIKLEKGCARCGYNASHYALDFNHIDPSTKSFTISGHTKKNLNRLLEEVAKCEVLCANCHRIETYTNDHHKST